MKAWIIPNILQFSGLGLGMFMVILATQSGAPLFEQVAVMAAGLAVAGLFYALGVGFETAHLKRVLQKKGLWENDMIRKKDLPK